MQVYDIDSHIDFTLQGFHDWLMLEPERVIDHKHWETCALGQYLQPTPKHLPVTDFVTPEQFLMYKEIGLDMGFRYVESGPLVRSSYRAEKHLF